MAGSPDSDLLEELPTLVSRSRDLARNHGVASGAIQTLVDNVVGTGLRLSALPDYKALGKDKEWADN
jgi:capsid protein